MSGKFGSDGLLTGRNDLVGSGMRKLCESYRGSKVWDKKGCTGSLYYNNGELRGPEHV